MKVSIDNILGSARMINSQKQVEEEGLDKRKKEVKIDTLTISGRIDSRLDTIEREFREIQSSLTKNQIVRDGIDQMKEDYRTGGVNIQNILNDVTFEKSHVLRSFVGEAVNQDILNDRGESIHNMVTSDIDRLKRLQVELENITASNLAGADKVENIMGSVNRAFAEAGSAGVESISRVRPDAVMRLIK